MVARFTKGDLELLREVSARALTARSTSTHSPTRRALIRWPNVPPTSAPSADFCQLSTCWTATIDWPRRTAPRPRHRPENRKTCRSKGRTDGLTLPTYKLSCLKWEESNATLSKRRACRHVLALTMGMAQAQDLAPLNSDSEPDRMDWSELDAKFGALPAPAAGTKIGGVSKTLTNEYWRWLGQGYQNVADRPGHRFRLSGRASEGDQLGQLSIAENLINQGFSALLLSPQTDANLVPAVETAKAAGIPVFNVNDAVIPAAEHYVGNVRGQRRERRQLVHRQPCGWRQGRGDRGPSRRLCCGSTHRWFHRDHHRGGKFKVVAPPSATGAGKRRSTPRRRSFSKTPIWSASTPTTTAWRWAWSRR